MEDLDLKILKSKITCLTDVVRKVYQHILDARPIRIQMLNTNKGPVPVTQVTKQFHYNVLNSCLFEDTFKVEEYSLQNLFDQEVLNCIEEGLKTIPDNIPKEGFGLKEKEVLKSQIHKLMLEKSELEKIEFKYLETQRLKNILNSNLEREKEKTELLIKCLNSSSGYIKEIMPETLTPENIVGWVEAYVLNCEEYIRQCGKYNMEDYIRYFGEEFEPLMAVLYRYKERKRNIEDLIITIKNYNETLSEVPLHQILQIYLETSDNVEQFCKQLKTAIKKRGMFMRRVGENTEYYGITSEFVADYELYKKLAEERLLEIKMLRERVKRMSGPMFGEFEDWCSKNEKNKFKEMLSYVKAKLYRRRIVKNIFGEIKFSPGKKFCGLVITYWNYKYLQSKSLESVLNSCPEKVKTMKEASYIIKALTKLSRVMVCKRALLWARNKMAQVLGREQARKRGNIDQKEQDIRFYNTYLFQDNLTLDDFLKIGLEMKIMLFQKQYKQLDREIGAKFLGRFYGANADKSNTQRKQMNVCKTIQAVFKKEQMESLNICPPFLPKRNPVGAYKKIMGLIENYCRDKIDFNSKNDLIDYMKSVIPSLTYGGDAPDGYVVYCSKIIKAYEGRVSSALECYRTDELTLKLERNKLDRLREKREKEDSSEYDSDSDFYSTNYSDDDLSDF